MTETREKTDERRARELCDNCHHFYDGVPKWRPSLWQDRPEEEREYFRQQASAIRASDEAAGMVLVPREATDAMCLAWVRKFDDGMGPRKMWDIMIAANEPEPADVSR
jgi:hypothetical protein